MAWYRGAPVSKLLHVLFAQQDGSRLFQSLDHCGIFAGHALGKQSAGASRLYARRINQVLQSDGDTVQWPAPTVVKNFILRFLCLGQGQFRCHSYERIEQRIELLNSLEASGGEVYR